MLCVMNTMFLCSERLRSILILNLYTLYRSAMMRTVVFIATRPIEQGSELLVDYRLKGTESNPLPSWYPKDDEIAPEEDDMKSPQEMEEKRKEGTDGALVDKYLG